MSGRAHVLMRHFPAMCVCVICGQIDCPLSAKRFCAKGFPENSKTMTMATAGFINENVKAAGSTLDIRVQYVSKFIPNLEF